MDRATGLELGADCISLRPWLEIRARIHSSHAPAYPPLAECGCPGMIGRNENNITKCSLLRLSPLQRDAPACLARTSPPSSSQPAFQPACLPACLPSCSHAGVLFVSLVCVLPSIRSFPCSMHTSLLKGSNRNARVVLFPVSLFSSVRSPHWKMLGSASSTSARLPLFQQPKNSEFLLCVSHCWLSISQRSRYSRTIYTDRGLRSHWSLLSKLPI